MYITTMQVKITYYRIYMYVAILNFLKYSYTYLYALLYIQRTMIQNLMIAVQLVRMMMILMYHQLYT